MEKYTPADFWKYFKEAWIRDNEGKPWNVYTPSRDNPNAVTVARSEGTKTQYKDIKLDEMTWENIALPDFGYIDVGRKGVGLYYVQRMVKRITSKGVSPHTCDIVKEPYVLTQLQILGLDDGTYRNNCRIRTEHADELFNPEYTPLAKAIELLQSEPETTGFALTHDIALVLGNNAETAFVLLFKQIPYGYSHDGKEWKFYAPEYKDTLVRQLGKFA